MPSTLSLLVRPFDPYGELQPPPLSGELRCGKCGKLLAELVTAPFRVVCARCRYVNNSAT